MLFLFLSLATGSLLSDYVNESDPSFTWNVVSETQFKDGTSFLLELTSQAWPPQPNKANRYNWVHWLTINIPKATPKTDHCFFLIRGGENNNKQPEPNYNLWNMTTATSSVTAELLQVPNEPLTLCNENKPRTEDALIALTWRHFFQYGQAKWLLRFPMVKSAVKAMDIIQEFTFKIKKSETLYFTAQGASKRGWVTWLLPAVDTRVVAIVPMVIDVLNFKANLNHHYQVYGGWSFALKDYLDMNITNYLNTPKVDSLMSIIDPMSYLDSLTVPKYIISAAGDEFFVPESTTFYYQYLKGQKYQRIVPNTGHGLQGQEKEVQSGITTFWKTIINSVQSPIVTFDITSTNDNAWITYNQTRTSPYFNQKAINLWKTYNPKARDFRNYPVKPLWNFTQVGDLQKSLSVNVQKPETGYFAFFLEVVFEVKFDTAINLIKFTSGVVVLPTTLPFPPCGDICRCGDSCTPSFTC